MKMIPLQYLAYFPAAVFLQQGHRRGLAWGWRSRSCGSCSSIVAARTMFHYGVRRYSGFGG